MNIGELFSIEETYHPFDAWCKRHGVSIGYSITIEGEHDGYSWIASIIRDGIHINGFGDTKLDACDNLAGQAGLPLPPNPPEIHG